MRQLDLANNYKSPFGFDSFFTDLYDTVDRRDYPACNIIKKSQNLYEITLAVAGYSIDELKIESKENQLTITGTKSNEEIDKENVDITKQEYLHQGINLGSFERVFKLADTLKIIEAKMNNGLLNIKLESEIPEKEKPKVIKITKS